jgi:hypothetical protein
LVRLAVTCIHPGGTWQRENDVRAAAAAGGMHEMSAGLIWPTYLHTMLQTCTMNIIVSVHVPGCLYVCLLGSGNVKCESRYRGGTKIETVFVGHKFNSASAS